MDPSAASSADQTPLPDAQEPTASSSSSSSMPPPLPTALLSSALSPSLLPSASSSATPVLSKSALKRAAKQAAFEAGKQERRQRERDARKEKKKAKRADAEAGINVDEFNAQREERIRKKQEEKRFENMQKAKEGTFFNARIVIDLGFDELMHPQEIKSMGGQMAYVYNAHRHSAVPFRSLLITHLDQRLKERMEKGFWEQANNRRWAGTEWWDGKELDGLWKGEVVEGGASESTTTTEPAAPVELTEEEMMEALNDGPTAQPTTLTPTPTSAPIISSPPHLSTTPEAPHPRTLVGPLPSRSAQENVVYLTADSPHEIDALEEGMTYVIGGIVDHNRYKNLCLEKAEKLGIKTARLPIGTYLSAMPTRKVLTVNQVYEILTGWVELRDWEAVLTKVIPNRKFSMKSDRRKRPRKGEEGFVEGAEEESEDEEMQSGGEEEEERRGKNATSSAADGVVPEETEEEEQERLNG